MKQPAQTKPTFINLRLILKASKRINLVYYKLDIFRFRTLVVRFGILEKLFLPYNPINNINNINSNKY